jgi:heat shock protein HslJ
MKLMFSLLLAITFSVSCQSSKSESEGPGSEDFLVIKEQLSGKWTIETMNHTAVTAEQKVNGSPELEFNPDDSLVTGFTGCNHLNGTIHFGKSGELTFGALATTKMYCQDVNEAAFLDNLTKTTRYSREGNVLTLSDNETALMTFKKSVK